MMTLIDYGSQYTGSTMSSDTNSEGAVSRQTRVRTVRLVRPQTHTLPPPTLTCRHGPSLGFSITGGREHGTGIFVSQVEPGSEAHRQGLMAGDQIVRVNGFAVDDAVHKEVFQLISNHTHLILKVRSVGMIPVKEKRTDSLSWHIISDCNSSIRSSPPLQEKIHDVRITIMVAPRQKLGCGICKGPDWKPGIFIQFTKDGGVAREAGLRPGDQILLCNSVDFTDIAFNEAVNIMKSSRQLDLVVRKSVGTELFPGESSGYNSSASSVTGDQSPSWSDSKRLSIVKEESMDLEDRLNHYDRFKTKKWEKIEWDEDSDSQHQNKPIYQHQYKPTIINLSENGTTITNNCPDIYNQEDENSNGFNTVVNKKKLLADICLVSHQHQHETKTVLVEVHRSDLEAKEQLQNQGPGGKLVKSPSNASVASSSLSSAISQEILRRSEKVKPTLSIDDQLQKRKILKNVDDDKQQQHSKLMDEFKRAHKKMFKNNGEENGTQNTEDRQLKNRVGNENGDDVGRLNVVSSFNSSSSSNGNSFGNEAVQTQARIQAQQQPQQGKVISASTTPSNSTPTKPNNGQSLLLPPPPPPLPQGEKRNGGGNVATSSTTTTTDSSSSVTNNKAVKPKAPPPPPPIKTSTLSFHQPPPCPTPDYDNLSINSQSNLNHNTHNTLTRKGGLKNGNASQNDKVEMDSLDSYKLNQPAEVSHKPPSTYFPLKKQVVNSNTSTLNRNNQSQNQNNNNNGTLTKPRPVSVVIGEYPSGTLRPTPRKLDFLQQNSNSMDKTDGASQQQQLIDKFTSELSQTLSRSNLRKKTESVTNGHQ